MRLAGNVARLKKISTLKFVVLKTQEGILGKYIHETGIE
jgi:hypothetical protein